MPGKLHDDAVCWWCGKPVIGTVKTTWRGVVKVEFVHQSEEGVPETVCLPTAWIDLKAAAFLEARGVI
jgi:hypothetical protein